MEYLYQIKNYIKNPFRRIFFPDKQRQYLADTIAFPGFNKADLLSRLKRIEKEIEDTFCMTYGDGLSDINIKKLIDLIY